MSRFFLTGSRILIPAPSSQATILVYHGLLVIPAYAQPKCSSSFGFANQGTPYRIFHLPLFLCSVLSSAISAFTTSLNLLLAYPVSYFLATPSSASIYPSYFLRTCPYLLNLVSRVFSPNRPTCAVPLILIPDLVHYCHP